MKNSFLFSVLAWLVLAASISAQEITFTASVDRTTIAAGEQLRLTVTLSNAQERFTAPDLGGLVVMAGPHESSSFNFINGRSTSTVSRTWVLTATQPGKYTIGPARVKVMSRMIETDPISIEVSKGSSPQGGAEVQRAQQSDPNLFIIVSLSKSKAYVGEPVVASYHVYNRYSAVEQTGSTPPQLNGFWSEELDASQARAEDKVINGLQYRVVLVKQQLLLPQRAGKLRIEPMTLNCVVNRSFFNRGTAVEVKSNAVEFTAVPLPAGAPADFTGAVGEFSLDLQADRLQAKADEAIEVTVKLSGKGNLKLIEAPRPSFPSDFEAYEPKTSDRITVNASGMSGTRGFQYTVIPRHDGRFDLGALSLSYFDPKAGEYRQLRSQPLVIDVLPGDAGPSSAPVTTLRTDVVDLGRDIRFIRPGDGALRPKGQRLFGSWPWLAGMAAPPFLLLVFLGWDRRRRRLAGDAEATRRARAEKLARQRLRQAADALKSGSPADFYSALSKALHGYAADKFALGAASVSAAALAERLPSEEGQIAAKRFGELVGTCDMARFAPVEDRPRKELYEQALAIIQQFERIAR
jgi:hypothetical protein